MARRSMLFTGSFRLPRTRSFDHCGEEELQQFGEPQIKSLLSNLAVEGNVAAGTQDQAKSALLFRTQATRFNDPTTLQLDFPS